MSYTFNDDAISIVDSNLNQIAVSQSQTISTVSQSGFIQLGVSGSTSIYTTVDSQGNQIITGSVTVNNLTFVSGANLSVFVTASNVLPITGSVAIIMPSGSYGGQIEGRTADGATTIGNPLLVAGEDGTTTRNLLVDSLGRIVTAPAGSSTAVTSSLVPGYITTAALVQAAVRATAYTEQTSNAQRSIVSANANDTGAGTGARTVRITYFDATFNGPFTETITLTGTTPVNTTNTDICFIEKIEVVTVGSGGVNAGIISLRTTTGGGGSTFASIAANDNRTFYTHHYVRTGQTVYLTGLSVGHTGTTVGSGGAFVIKAKVLGVPNAVDVQVSDFIRLYGQSSTITRNWSTAIKVTGPAIITVYVTPETASSTIYRSALDLYDQ